MRDYVVPAELPPPPALLVGRSADVERVVDALTNPSDASPVVVIVGQCGVGKTALALGVAQLVADRYRDGQLLARLDRATGDDGVKDVLRMFVAALGSSNDQPPDELADLEKRYAELTGGGRRVLVILDAATSAQQVRRLLPQGRACAALVTAREELPDWSRWRRVPITGLDGSASLRVLDTLVGAGRVQAEPEAAERIVEVTGGNPFLLHLAGLALATRRHWTLATALSRMDEVRLPVQQQRYLPDFVGALNLGFALLTEPERYGLALLGLVNQAPFARWMLGALVCGADNRGVEAEAEADAFAERILNRLVRVRFLDRMVEETSGVWIFRIPDQVRAYIQARMVVDIDEDTLRRAADELARARERRGVRSADELLRGRVYHSLEAGELATALTTAQEAIALCAERSQGRASQERAGRGPDQTRVDRSRALAALAEVQGELGWLEEARRYAEEACSLNVAQSLPRALRCLGLVNRRLRRLDQANDLLAQAYQKASLIDDLGECIRTLRESGLTLALRREHEAALQTLAHAVQLCEESGGSAQRRLSTVLWAKGAVLLAQLSPDEADDAVGAGDVMSKCVKEALAREADEALAEAEAICLAQAPVRNLWVAWVRHQRALVALAMGQPGQALKLARRAGDDFRDMQHRYGVGHCRLLIGQALAAERNFTAAIPAMEEALQTFVGCGDRWVEAHARLVLARTHQKATHYEEEHGRTLRVDVARRLTRQPSWTVGGSQQIAAHLGKARGLIDRVAQDFDDLGYVAGRQAVRKLRTAIERDRRASFGDWWSWIPSWQPAVVRGRGRAGAFVP